jgi:uncharacterized protein
MASIDRRALLLYLQSQFRIDWYGCHGISHWARVRANGLMLARLTGANPDVVELFAFFHDSCRINERQDEGHGARGALLADQLRGRFFEATDQEMSLLTYACSYHSDGLDSGDITVLACWDSDRLDLGRVGITPETKYLCTSAARDRVNLERSHQRALAWKRRWLIPK